VGVFVMRPSLVRGRRIRGKCAVVIVGWGKYEQYCTEDDGEEEERRAA